jgi:hypothetical protein
MKSAGHGLADALALHRKRSGRSINGSSRDSGFMGFVKMSEALNVKSGMLAPLRCISQNSCSVVAKVTAML